ncbi:AAA family ATPase [Deinococcus sp. AJ005]|uniref:AAA family ATPase n=1 Tax=Deinococcus sp. AJ005 TaxID=2652443 RepID=UPI00125CAD16|nr:AAA family ATPase [Deinococcus sp. AJ005]QFP77966.1 SARP family transcriptional regulator [Deinococcus sp. AJ005]
MLTVHLLGHAHVTYNNRPVPLSAKAVALITYLTIEKLPQHRERLADLLWNTPEARKNLRVELARIRSAGLNLFPLSRQLLYLENVETDLNGWLAGLGSDLDQAGLAQWLSTLRGVPLSGLEDLGSPAFQEWIDHQRWVLTEQTEEVLARAYRQFQRGGKGWATRAIAARAEALGFTHPGEFLMEDADAGLELPELAAALPAARPAPLPVPALPTAGRSVLDSPAADGPLHFRIPEREAALRDSLKRAAHAPQVLVLHGPTGSGKSHEAGRALTEGGWLTLRISNSRAGRLIVATLAQALLAHPFFPAPSVSTPSGSEGGEQPVSPDAGMSAAGHQSASVQTLQGVLLRPGSLEEDVVKVATVLATVPRPVAIVLDHAHNGPVELASVLEFLLNVPSAGPRALVMLSRTPPSQAPLCRALLRRFGAAQSSGAQSAIAQSLVLEVAPLSLGSVVQALGAHGLSRGDADLHARAAVLVQRSGGNALHLLSLLQENGLEQGDVGRLPPAGHLPSAMRDTYLGEIDGWPAPLRDALSSLSVIQGDFSFGLVGSFPETARRGLTPAALLRDALERRALVETEPASALSWPAFGPVGDAAPGEPCYRFRAEGLRIALSGQLPQAERQELRRHLAAELEASQPGLALYYAERAGADADAERLRVAYRSRLPAGSPLLRSLHPAASTHVKPEQIRAAQMLSAPALIAPPSRPVLEPRQLPVGASPAVSWQGYLLSWEQGGWLSILSQGRYGHPHTLRVHLPVPTNLRDAPTLILRLVWRLDVFHAGYELGPHQMAFPLRFAVPGADGARVLTPDAPGDYTEEGQRQLVGADVTLGGWMEHELHFNMAGQAAERLDLHVRALDLALTIGELSLNGHTILPLTAAPERLGGAGSQDSSPVPRSLAVRH